MVPKQRLIFGGKQMHDDKSGPSCSVCVFIDLQPPPWRCTTTVLSSWLMLLTLMLL